MTTTRVQAIDLARGASILMVVVIHTLWIYGKSEIQAGTILGEVVHFIGKGTPMFLIAMGFSYTLSRNQSLILSFKRALFLLGVGYAMNFFKFIFPILIGIMPDEFIQAYGWSVPANSSNLLHLLLTGDILQLAGVSLFFMGLVNHFFKHQFVPLIIALVMIVSTSFIRGFRLGIEGIDYLMDLLWGAEFNVYFAVFPWAAFIFLGMFFGKIYQQNNQNASATFRMMLFYGIVFLVIGGGLCLYDANYHFGDYFHLGAGGAIYLAGFNFILFWIAHVMLQKIKPNKFFDFLIYASKRVTSFYFIQWVIICWFMGIFGFQQMEQLSVLILIPVMMILSLGIQMTLDRVLAKKIR